MQVKGLNGQVEFDGEWVTIRRKGALGRMTVGKGDKRIHVASLTAVQLKPAGGRVNGFIQFTVAGGKERRSAFGQQTMDAAGDENSVVFRKGQMPPFVGLRDAIERAVADQHKAQSAPPTTVVNSASDPTQQLRELASLRDAGIVTAEEFEAKKIELFGAAERILVSPTRINRRTRPSAATAARSTRLGRHRPLMLLAAAAPARSRGRERGTNHRPE